MKHVISFLMICYGFSVSAQVRYNSGNVDSLDREIRKSYKKSEKYLNDAVAGMFQYLPPSNSLIDTILTVFDTLEIHFKDEYGYNPIRQNQVEDVYFQLKRRLGRVGRKHLLKVMVKGYELNELIPNYFVKEKDESRMSFSREGIQHVKNISSPYLIDSGLTNRHIALWNSHGWYYENKLDRWEWQRAHMFTTVEDLFTTSYVLPFLVPMLEHAGANIYLPRERDIQTAEIVVDNDSSGYSESDSLINIISNEIGFRYSPFLSDKQNPFEQGDSRLVECKPESDNFAQWVPEIQEDGDYAVYVSYQTIETSSEKAMYTVYHSAGETQYVLNQKMGGGTWVYLGTFNFKKGINPEVGSVRLSFAGEAKKVVSMDAARFGGGMGSVARNGKTSGRPRWTEAARYYLQYAGTPDSLVYSVSKGTNDYTDDYRSRGHWVNYMLGDPSQKKGLGIPIDLAFAFHTDAGHKMGIDTLVGTLMIYSTTNLQQDKTYPEGKSRLANRDLSDLISTQIVNDIRNLHQPNWVQRQLWDKRYSEATYPEVPTVLLELLSHQNMGDMQYGLDPTFRFTVSRAIYKAMLRFLSVYYQSEYVVQPLPIEGFSVELKGHNALLRWHPVNDKLEPTAIPEKYIVYTRLGNAGWDNGQLVNDTVFMTETLAQGSLYSYKIAAVNAGGESFPSTALSVCLQDEEAPVVLVIDAFDRVAAPQLTNEGNFAGFTGIFDEGIAWGMDYATTGRQYEFDQRLSWVDDDNPGHGASLDDLGATIFAGNLFNHSFIHGEAIRSAGYNFVSVTRNAVERRDIRLSNYSAIDIIFGEQRTTLLPDGTTKFQVFTDELIDQLENYLQRSDARLLVSGAYLGSDVFLNRNRKVLDKEKNFVKNQLGFIGRSDKATSGNTINILEKSGLAFSYPQLKFNVDFCKDLYRVESPDAIDPSGKSGETILRYADNNKSAGVRLSNGYRVISFGFPLETISDKSMRESFVKALLDDLLK